MVYGPMRSPLPEHAAGLACKLLYTSTWPFFVAFCPPCSTDQLLQGDFKTGVLPFRNKIQNKI